MLREFIKCLLEVEVETDDFTLLQEEPEKYVKEEDIDKVVAFLELVEEAKREAERMGRNDVGIKEERVEEFFEDDLERK